MKQSKLMSLLETTLSTAAGFGISLGAQWFFLPLIGVTISLTQNVTFAVIMTFVSLARQFMLRRVFEALHIRRPLSAFVQAVVAERFRQIEAEGWSIEHDDKEHATGELARAGACYALANAPLLFIPDPHDRSGRAVIKVSAFSLWGWDRAWWKPQGLRRDLVRSAALIIAEGEKFDRNRKRRSAS